MNYTPLPALSSSGTLAASNWNLWVHDNLMLSPAALATAKGDFFSAAGSGTTSVLHQGINGQMVETDFSITGCLKNSWAFIPVGGIIMWGGSLSVLPSNWQLCDGTNGTPDLRGRFVVGAGSSFAKGATGGSASANLEHDHNAPTSSATGAHSHAQGATGAGTSHTHTDTTSLASAGISQKVDGYLNSSNTNHTHTFTTDEELAHTHTNPTTNPAADHAHELAFSSQLSNAQSILPPYYALAYIMRMS